MSYQITSDIIVEEYLNNWFTYDELAQYLCISVEDVENCLNNVSNKNSNKIIKHKELIDLYYTSKQNGLVLPEDRFIVQVADYIIDNKASIRETAQKFNMSKTVLHERIHEELPNTNIYKYKKVFSILMDNKSLNTNNKQIIDQVLTCYELFNQGLSSHEICEKMQIGRNVLQRNLTTRLKKIDKSKYESVKQILRERQLQGLSHKLK